MRTRVAAEEAAYYSEYIQTAVSKTDSGGGGHVCLLCGTVIRSRNNVKRHFLAKHADLGCVYVCPGCRKTFEVKRIFLWHIKAHEPQFKGIDPEKCMVVKK